MDDQKSTALPRSHSTSPGAAPSLIPLVQPKWKRSVASRDSLPSSLVLNAPSAAEEGERLCCRICEANEARYTCPRCNVPYCSVACYKNHDDAAGGGSSLCTEAFYQDRVSSVLNLEAKEASGSMNSILSRSREAFEEPAEQLSENELWELAEALEETNLGKAESLLTPQLKAAFERAVQNGELSNVVQPWHPWWRPELVSNHDDHVDELTPLPQRQTLDERLLAIPSLKSLRTRPAASKSLSCNLVGVLYSIALTLRLYHGMDNALDACPEEAAMTLLSSSAVLREDARYTSVAEALVTCTTFSTAALRNGAGCNTPWTVLVEDVALLCENRRHVIRAVLEAIDIIKAAVKFIMKKNGTGEPATELRKARKKLEFYASWYQGTVECSQNLSSEIREWMEDWKHGSHNDDTIKTLRLPNSQCSHQSSSKKTAETTKSVNAPLLEAKSTRSIK